MKKLTFIVACSLLFSMQVHADETLKRGLAKAQYMLRQANVEKTEMLEELEQEKQAAEAKEAELKSKEKDLARNEKNIAKLKATLDLWQTEYEKLKEALAETRKELAQANNDSALQKALFEAQTDNFKTCEAHNSELVAVSFDLLDAYEGKSFSDALKQKDPFFGLKQVEIENLLQDYRHRLEDLSLLENQHLIQPIDTASVFGN